MDGTGILLRTTACTLIAFSLARLLLVRVQSPRVHRVAWALVLLQGWMVVPSLIQIPIRLPSTQINPVEAASLDVVPSDSPIPPQQSNIHTSMAESISLEPLPWLSILWLLGIAGTVFNYVRRYRNLLRQIPLGRKPEQLWEAEWQRAAQQLNVRKSHAIQFRITDRIGPLCCYVPFFYLVLVPQRLWNDLSSEQRVSILQHELSHFTRLDLWKSLCIRVLALPQWFNPAAWMAIRAFDEAAEWASDDLVMRAYGDDNNTSYASALLAIAEASLQPLPMSVAAGGGTLKTRIQRLIQPRFKEESNMTKSMMPLVLCGLAVLQTVRVEALAGEGEIPAKPTPALRATDRPPVALDSKGRVLPNSVRTGDGAATKTKPKIPDGATLVEVRYLPCTQVLHELNEFLDHRKVVFQTTTTPGEPAKFRLAAHEDSNSIILSGEESVVGGLVKLIRKLDIQPEMVMVRLLIAETSDRELTADDLKRCPKELVPWVKKHGRLEVLSRPQVMVLNNESGNVSVGFEKDNTEHALNVTVTPRIQVDEHIDIELVVGRSKTISEEDGNWTKDETSSGRRATAASAETVIVSGIRTRSNENDADLVIAMTPYVVSTEEAGDTVTR